MGHECGMQIEQQASVLAPGESGAEISVQPSSNHSTAAMRSLDKLETSL